jgi:hypothetical protein
VYVVSPRLYSSRHAAGVRAPHVMPLVATLAAAIAWVLDVDEDPLQRSRPAPAAALSSILSTGDERGRALAAAPPPVRRPQRPRRPWPSPPPPPSPPQLPSSKHLHATRVYRLFDLGGSGLKTCTLARGEAAEACMLTNVGTCPASMPVRQWIRSMVPSIEGELLAGAWFGFSLAGLFAKHNYTLFLAGKLGASPKLKMLVSNAHSNDGDTILRNLFNLSGAARLVVVSDGVAHLAGSMSCKWRASRPYMRLSERRRVVNLAIGTGVACARTLETGEAVECDFRSCWRCPALDPRQAFMRFLAPTTVFAAGVNSTVDEYKRFANNWKLALGYWLTSGWPYGNASRPEAVYITGWPRELPLFVNAIETLAKELASVVRVQFGPPLAQVRGLLTELTGRPAACACEMSPCR